MNKDLVLNNYIITYLDMNPKLLSQKQKEIIKGTLGFNGFYLEITKKELKSQLIRIILGE